MNIEQVPITDLVEYANNARTHSDKQIAKLVASIKEFGWTNPLLIDESNKLIAGHGRLRAARELGMESVPCLRFSHLSREQQRAYVLADNRLALESGWDRDLLSLELNELRDAGFGLDLTGFDEKDISDLVTIRLTGGLTDPDSLPEPASSSDMILGDGWELGRHRLVCGDSTLLSDIDRLMQGDCADVVWTDPPYNVAYETAAGSISNDDMSDAAFGEFLLAAFRQIVRVMRPGASIYVAHADGQPAIHFRAAWAATGIKLSGCLVWKKSVKTLSRSDYQWIHEPILYGWKEGKAHRWFGGRRQTTVSEMPLDSPFVEQEDGTWIVAVGGRVFSVSGDAQVTEHPTSYIEHDKPRRSAAHPTMKPVALIRRMLENSARKGDIVLDAFGGSGSTLIAAEQLGMSARVMELSPTYCDVIVRRWEEFTGEKAVPMSGSHGSAN